MNKETYTQIIDKLNTKIQNCSHYLDEINTTEDLRKLSLEKVIELRDFCKQEMSDMDKILKSELYHILGMGDLSAIQTNGFIKAIKEYSSYRSLIKTIAMNLNGFDNLPGIPVRSEYKLSVLFCGLKLTAGPEDGYLENETVDEGQKTTQIANNLPFTTVDATHIQFHKNNIASVAAELYLFDGMSATGLAIAIANKRNYCGIAWTTKGEYAVGTAKTNTAKQKLNCIISRAK